MSPYRTEGQGRGRDVLYRLAQLRSEEGGGRKSAPERVGGKTPLAPLVAGIELRGKAGEGMYCTGWHSFEVKKEKEEKMHPRE